MQVLIKAPRTCVVCRKIDEKSVLLRIVRQDGLVFDFAQMLLGRGLYVHCSESCLARKKFANCISKVGKRRSVSSVGREVREVSSNADVNVGVVEGSGISPQISLESLIERGRRCLELLDVNGNNSKKVLLAKKIFERTKEIVSVSSKSEVLGSVIKKRPLRL